MAENPNAAPDISDLSFEEALKELETIVEKLENGQMKLEEAVSAYERGTALRQHCEKQLNAAESRLTALTANDVKTSQNASADTESALER